MLTVCVQQDSHCTNELLLAGTCGNASNMSSIWTLFSKSPSPPSEKSVVLSHHSPPDESPCSFPFSPLHTAGHPLHHIKETLILLFPFVCTISPLSFPILPQNKEVPIRRRGWNKCKRRCRETDRWTTQVVAVERPLGSNQYVFIFYHVLKGAQSYQNCISNRSVTNCSINLFSLVGKRDFILFYSFFFYTLLFVYILCQ